VNQSNPKNTVLEKFVEKYIKSNQGTSRKEITNGLKAALSDYKSGINRFWRD
jgi:hypothetical protein